VDEDRNEYSAHEMAHLYQEHPNEWLLLEVLATNEAGRAERLKLLKHSKDKNDLYDFLMDEVKDWELEKEFHFCIFKPGKGV
jgi:hypothetical protein